MAEARRTVPTGWRLALPVAIVGVLGCAIAIGAASHAQYEQVQPRAAALQDEVEEIADRTGQAVIALQAAVGGYRGMFAEPGQVTDQQFRAYTRGTLGEEVRGVTYAPAEGDAVRYRKGPEITDDLVVARDVSDQAVQTVVRNSHLNVIAGVRDSGRPGVVLAQFDVAELMTSVIGTGEMEVQLVDLSSGEVLWGEGPALPAPTMVQATILGTPSLAIRTLGVEAGYAWKTLLAGLTLTALACALLWRALDTHRIRRTADDLQLATQRLNFLAERDTLTGLGNREALQSWLTAWDAEYPDRAVGMIYIDLVGFRQINATYGHVSGDIVLRELGRRLSILSEDADSIVARLSGIHFVLLRAADRGNLPGLASTVQTVLAQPIAVGDRDVHMGSEIAVVMRPEHGRGLDDLLGNADHALRSANHRDAVVFFDPAMAETGAARQQLTRDLRAAVQRPDENFHLVFQPQVDMHTGQLFAAEALLRWRAPDGRAIPPDTFIPLASDNGLIPALGRWVLREACRTVAMWRVDVPAVVAVNVDVRQLHDGFAEQVAATLRQAGAQPEWLVIEVTESAAMESAAQAQLDQIRALGVGISIDDFGTGYSSLSRLAQLPAGQLKIDRAFVKDLVEPDRHSLEIVRTIAALATSLDLQTVAEGVETYEQAQALMAEGIRAGQGFLFCAPVAAEICLGLWATGVMVPTSVR